MFPTSWYPATTPENVQRWTVPSCAPCNNRLGSIEKELFVRLAICVDPQKAEASGLSAKALRSMGVNAEGISLGERLKRRALKRKVIRSMKPYKPNMETFPGLGPHAGFAPESQVATTFPADQVEEVAKKIVRGCEYSLANGRIIEEPYRLAVHFVHEDKIPQAVTRIFGGPSAETTHLGPGFVVTRAEAHDEPGSVVYKIVLWGTVVIYASILPA